MFELITPVDYEKAENIPAEIYARLDADTRHLELAKEYLAAGKNKLKDEKEYKLYYDYLISASSRTGLPALEHAERLVRHVQEGVFSGEIHQALAKANTDPTDPRVEIEVNFTYPRVNDPVEFRITFKNPAYNDATARESFVCEWDFGDKLKEKGWSVAHYFRCPGTYTVTTRFLHKELAPVDGPKMSLTIHTSAVAQCVVAPTPSTSKLLNWLKKRSAVVGKHWAEIKEWLPAIHLGPRTRTELLRVAITLGAALLALWGTAREQFAQLECLPGLVAVFLVGFGADTIKNLLTQKQ